MPVVGYVPPEKVPEPMAFFSYGCCVSTSQALWVLISTFIVAVFMIILCAMSAVFVRWIYKRRLRKKVEALKERYRKEEKEKHEREQELLQVAKRPLVPRPPPANTPNKELKDLLIQAGVIPSVVNTSLQHQIPPPSLAEYTAMDGESDHPIPHERMKPPARGEMIFDGKQKMALKVEPATVARVIHHIAKGDVTEIPNQYPYPHLVLGCAPPKEEEQTQPDSSSTSSSRSTSAVALPKKKVESEEDETQRSEYDAELAVMKTEEDNSDESTKNKEKKSSRRTGQDEGEKLNGQAKRDVGRDGKLGSSRKPSEDFPYYQPRKLTRREDKGVLASSVRSYQTTQKSLGATPPASPLVVHEVKRPDPKKKTYNVYELRRLADEQAGKAETEEVCEMIRNRNPMEGFKKTYLGEPEMKRQTQKANDAQLEMSSPSP